MGSDDKKLDYYSLKPVELETGINPKIDRNKTKAYCTSPVCCVPYYRKTRVIKEVSIQTNICPDCGYYLYWHNPALKHKLF